MLFVLDRVRYSGYTLWTLTVGWVLVAVLAVVVWSLMRSPWGRVLKAIRENEDAVRSLGKGVYSYKMQALIMGGDHGHARRVRPCPRPWLGAARQLRP